MVFTAAMAAVASLNALFVDLFRGCVRIITSVL